MSVDTERTTKNLVPTSLKVATLQVESWMKKTPKDYDHIYQMGKPKLSAKSLRTSSPKYYLPKRKLAQQRPSTATGENPYSTFDSVKNLTSIVHRMEHKMHD